MADSTFVKQTFVLPTSNLKIDEAIMKSAFPTSSARRHAADNLEVNDFVDLTDDHCCFICNEVISRNFYLLAKAVTNTSKTHIARKLGELVGKSYIVVVSEDDCICQCCVNFFNRLDNLEIELKTVKNNIMERLQRTYLKAKNRSNTIPNHVYKALQLILSSEKDSNQPPNKKFCSESLNLLKDVRLQNCDLQQNKCTKAEVSKKTFIQAVDNQHYENSFTSNINSQTTGTPKGNVINGKNNGAKNLCSSNINNDINFSGHLLSKQNDMHTVNSIKIDHQNDTTAIDCKKNLSETDTTFIYTNTNFSYAKWDMTNFGQTAQSAVLLDTTNESLLLDVPNNTVH